MALKLVTGSLWDHMQVVIPANQYPRLWFRPDGPSVSSSGLQTDMSVRATYNQATGFFSVELDNRPGMRYRPWVDYLIPGQETEPPEDRARGRVEWDFWVYPANGGPIWDLTDVPIFGPTIMLGEGAPPSWIPSGGLYIDVFSPNGADVYSEGALIT